jgi:hypothetical protein
MFNKSVSNQTSGTHTYHQKQPSSNTMTQYPSFYSNVLQLQKSIGNQRVGRMLTSQSPTMPKAESIQPAPKNVIQGKWIKHPLKQNMYFDDFFLHFYNAETNEYYEKYADAPFNPSEENKQKLIQAINKHLSTSDPLSKVIHGHGYSEKKKIVKSPQFITLYGPFGSTLTRAVSKWLREKGPLPPGSIKEISNDEFDSLKKKFGGVCTSFMQALWDTARESEFPKVVEPGDLIPELSLEPDNDEVITPQENLLQVRYFTKINQIAAMTDDRAHLHWAACLQEMGKDIMGTDTTIILHPELSDQVYPPTQEEILNEQRYQHRLMNPTKKESPTTINKAFVSQGASSTTQFPEALQNTLNTDFDSSQKLDEQVKRLDVLSSEYNIPRNALLRYLGSQGKKGYLD